MRTLLLPLLLALTACTPLEDEAATAACPCAEGWTCCADVCVRGGPEVCPAPPVPDTTPPEAPRLDGARPASPARLLQVELEGRSEPGATVRIHAAAACAGAPTATVTADAAGAFRAPVTLVREATRTFSASARDAAGNAGPCSAPLTLTHDGVAPPVPVLVGVAPASPSATTTRPLVLARAEPGVRVVLHADAACTQALPFEGRADAEGGVQVAAQLTADATATYWARAVDDAGNASACTADSVTFIHDGTAPAPPALAAITPPSPSPATTPTWEGAAEPGARVRVHAHPACADTPIAQAPADATGRWVMPLAATRNALMRRYASATDAAGNRSACVELGSYVHDDIRPARPTFGAFTPASPTRLTPTPRVVMHAEPGVTVVVQGDNWSAGQPRAELARGVAGEDGRVELVLALKEGTTSLDTHAVDAAGNVTDYYAPSTWTTYVYDVTPPATPVLELLSEPSPSASATSLWVVGSAEASAQVSVHADAACAGPALGTGTSTALQDVTNPQVPPGFTVRAAVPQDVETHYYVRATDAAGNASACAGGVPFRHRPAGERAWSAHQALPPNASAMALDAQGTHYVLSLTGGESTGRVELFARAPGAGAWTSLRLHSTTAYTYGSATALQVNARGDVVVSWAQSTAGQALELRVERRAAGAEAWEALAPPAGAGSGSPPHLAWDGSVLLCWPQPLGTDPQTWRRLCSTAPAGGAWGAPEEVQPSVLSATDSAAVATGAGGAVAVEKRGAWNASVRPLLATVRTAAGGWGATVELPAAETDFSLHADAAGGAWLVTWGRAPADGTTTLWARHLAPGAAAWGAPEALAQGVRITESYWRPRVATGVEGGLAVGWRPVGEGFTVATVGDDGRWAVAAPLAHPTDDDDTPLLSPGAPGEWWAQWTDRLGPLVQTPSYGVTRPYTVRTARLGPSGTWDAPQTLLYEPGPIIFALHGGSFASNAGGEVAMTMRWLYGPLMLRVLR